MITHEQRIAELNAELAALGPAPKPNCDRSNPYPPGTPTHNLANWEQATLEQQLIAIQTVLHDDDFGCFLPLDKQRNPTAEHIADNRRRTAKRDRAKRYPLGSLEYGCSAWTRSQLERSLEQISGVLSDNERSSFLPLE